MLIINVNIFHEMKALAIETSVPYGWWKPGVSGTYRLQKDHESSMHSVQKDLAMVWEKLDTLLKRSLAGGDTPHRTPLTGNTASIFTESVSS